MLENTTVTLSLADFDTLRKGEREHRSIAGRLARCFEYSCQKHDSPEPPECQKCSGDMDCSTCEINAKNPLYTEKLTVDLERLVRAAKGYALYGKDIETDLESVTVERKADRVDA